MVSIQTNISVVAGMKYGSSKTTTKNDNQFSDNVFNNKGSVSGVDDFVFLFSSEVKSDALQQFNDQNAVFHFEQMDDDIKSKLVYNGAPISELSVEEAQELINEDGFFGIAETSRRIIDFVFQGAGGDVEKLKAGREGVLRGFAAAEKAWGGRLPDICCETIDRSIKAIDEQIAKLGGNITEVTV